jgi:short-subunit dehydrogenase
MKGVILGERVYCMFFVCFRWVDIKESAIEKALNINCISLTLATKYALQVMVKQPQGGTILNISSMGGIFSMPHCPVYSATKHYVVGLTRSLGLAYSKSSNTNYFALHIFYK